jgi:hypothetical protein
LPEERLDYCGSLEVVHPGPFAVELTLYVDDPGLRIISLSLQGVGTLP